VETALDILWTYSVVLYPPSTLFLFLDLAKGHANIYESRLASIGARRYCHERILFPVLFNTKKWRDLHNTSLQNRVLRKEGRERPERPERPERGTEGSEI